MPTGRTPIRVTLDDARARLVRVTPRGAFEAQRSGALLVDVRTAEQRVAGGALPGATVVSLNDLEWRFDPEEAVRLPVAGDLGQLVILICEEGYCSSLAAIRLQDLGYGRATDVEGGFVAWRQAGLPLSPAG